MRRAPSFSLTFLVAAIALVGCSSGGGAPEELEQGSNQNLSIPEGEEVTREMYESGFRAFQSCMESIGYPLEDVKEGNLVIAYSYPSVANAHGAESCYADEFQQLDMMWQTRPEVLEKSETTQILRACLSEMGITPSENPLELNQQLVAAGKNITHCL